MSWVITAFVALLGALAGGAGMFAIGEACVKWYRISSFEGKSGYFVVLLMFAGVVGGAILGAIGARFGYAAAEPGPGSHGPWQLGAGLGAVGVGLLVVLGGSYLRSGYSPERGGRGLVIAWEVRLPAPADAGEFAPTTPPPEWPDTELRLQLVSVVRHKPIGHAEAVFDRAAFREENGQWVLPSRVGLFTSRGTLCVNLTLGGRDDGFWPSIILNPTEGTPWFEWSPWYRTNKGMRKGSDAEAVMYRFRFEKD